MLRGVVAAIDGDDKCFSDNSCGLSPDPPNPVNPGEMWP